ncbi:transcription initiation factor IIF beta subunit [Thelephora terrestris]|uniref:Transcription initiation factor IIF subunit beta n=1 Tax=Thelephora terrestris TaxID=56493 RepID=A0A9P6H4N9_9AGAM|nr:transcription initiation factor IIF beta subunit [Thelephora terrestris]
MEVEESENKPFDAELAPDGEETQPEPDEHMITDTATGRVWIVKIPRFLMERWANVNREDVHLATIRVFKASSRIKLYLPENPASPDEPREYELEMVQESVDNQLVVAEKEKESGSRARTTILAGKVKHECNLRPVFTEKYRKRVRERHREVNTRSRQIKMIDEVTPGRGSVNMLSSGVANASAFSDLVKTKQKPTKGFERMARMPRNQLLDMLFKLYAEKETWPIKLLRERTQQPEAFLKETLSDIAFLHRSGEHNGTWELKENFKEGAKPEAGPSGLPGMGGADFKMEDAGEDDYDEDEDDDDMEEVS